ncbi:shikimate kinase [Streptomyces sp. MUM 178J]|uniref:shikimate kinase n=1 Tax=Streptomyces sp. MUM 178J TaxID=2791991 RepID=UPI001F04ED52|nr:shikimate kinase [Streptomyces sp. MUM 178J]WRQ82841.1 shikimate kinase [Streptomyces sp. MUM 178J]
MTGPLAVLIGLPGSGKTTVGRLLARRLGADFRDTDADVERAAGLSVREILLERGEAAFRVLEREAVQRALAEHPGVLAVGGGAVLDDTTQRRLAGHRVVHLRVGAATAAARVGGARTRPLLADDPAGELRVLAAVRLPIYDRLAAACVWAEGRGPERTAEEIAALLPVAVAGGG